MKILITGLTLHNNKGGPALALSLINKLKEEFLDAEFYLSVPNSKNNLELEKNWALHYQINGVIGAIGIKELLFFNKMRRDDFVEFLRNVDLVVDLNALSYMDLPHLSYKKNLIRNLSIFTIRYFCNKLHIPLIRWTQSYGPFENYITKSIVKFDLKKQKNIFVRGHASLQNMKKLFKNKNIVAFPDIAITLSPHYNYYEKHLKDKKYITLSPSSVIYSIEEDKHIEHFRDIIKSIMDLGYEVVLVPHNLMTKETSLKKCDLKVSEKIIETFDSKTIQIVKEDIDAYELKGVISNAYLHIGARYHSIVASLSTHVPTIAFSWHEKYKDIMKMYGMESFVYDGREDISILLDYISEQLERRDEIIITLKEKQRILELEIEQNIKLFMDVYDEMQTV